MSTTDTPTEMERIAALIKAKREALGWTTRDLSAIAFGNENRSGEVSNIENNKKVLTIPNMEKLFKALKISVQYNED